MREISIPERVFLAVVCANALFVAYLGILVPERMDRSFTWALVPPLHARFVGVSYLFGGVYLIVCLLARHRSQVSPAFAAIGIFTGGLLLVTLLNLEAFDFDLVPVWVWTVSYVVYPVLGFGFAWASRHRDVPVEGSPLEPWARAFLQVQAAVFAVAGVGLLVAAGDDGGPVAVADQQRLGAVLRRSVPRLRLLSAGRTRVAERGWRSRRWSPPCCASPRGR